MAVGSSEQSEQTDVTLALPPTGTDSRHCEGINFQSVAKAPEITDGNHPRLQLLLGLTQQQVEDLLADGQTAQPENLSEQTTVDFALDDLRNHIGWCTKNRIPDGMTGKAFLEEVDKHAGRFVHISTPQRLMPKKAAKRPASPPAMPRAA